MPEATEYPPPDSQAGKLLDQEYEEEAARRGAVIKRAWAYYNGDHKKPLKVQQDGYDDNFVINNIEVFAEKLETFLIGDGLTFDAGSDRQPSADDDAIVDLWQSNRGDILQSNMALSGVLEGHVAVRLVPRQGWPAIQRIKQAHFAAFWDPFEIERVVWYRLQSGARRIDYVLGLVDGVAVDHDAPGWTELTYRAVRTVKDVLGNEALKWELVNTTAWPYDFPPIVDWQNLPNPNWYYGKADATSAIALNDVINFITSNLNRIVKHYASPKTIGTGFTAKDVVATAVGGLWTIDNPEAKVYNLELQADAALARWLAEVAEQALWQSGGLTDPQSLKDKLGQITNFGLRILFTDAIARIGKKQKLYGEGLEAIIERAFILNEMRPPDSITINWPQVLPDDSKAEAETLTMEFDRGLISKETYRERRGYNHEMEEGRIAQERTTGDIGSQILSNLAFNRGQ